MADSDPWAATEASSPPDSMTNLDEWDFPEDVDGEVLYNFIVAMATTAL